MNGISAGKPLERKSSFKNKKPPEIRQTLTSKYRLLKANPLLKLELEKKIDNSSETSKDVPFNTLKPLKEIVKLCDKIEDKFMPPPAQKLPQRPPLKLTKSLPPLNTGSRQRIEILAQPKNTFNMRGISQSDFKPGQLLSSTRVEVKQNNTGNKNGLKRTQSVKNKQQPNNNKPKQPIRRSLSAQHFDRKNGKASEPSECFQIHDKSVSFEDLTTQSNLNNKQVIEVSPIIEEKSLKDASSSDLIFKTPSAYSRRSVFNNKTPNTTNRRSLYLSTPTSEELKKRLNDWLKKRGKTIGEFPHLKCFGYDGGNSFTSRDSLKPPSSEYKEKPTVQDDENKENIETNIPESNSYEDLKIAVETEKVKQTDVQAESLDLAKGALLDLHKLIKEGYPVDQCESWLKSIKLKYKQLEEGPQYWECRAAIEEARGNITSAVECFRNAIVQGAEVNVVDKSLDDLLKKFSLLNINTENGTPATDRARIVRDARNVFKSSIIQFAVQERTMKKKNKEGTTVEKKFIVTPVRRSTRLSRSAYTSTPGVAMYSTLEEVDSPVRRDMDFKSNRALKD